MLKKREMDMTEGTIWKQLLLFMVPLLIGNLFQQLYNTVDSIVVGNFVGKSALAAVTSTTPIINTLIGLFQGFSTGAGVVIAQAYGAKDETRLRRSIHSAVWVTVLLGFLFMAGGYWLAPKMLYLMRTPDSVMAEADTYLRIYFLGALGLVLYNMGAGILQAVGDSTRPLYFLILSSLLNIVLDLLFVIRFDLAVAGVALATILSQFISAAALYLVLCRGRVPCRLQLKYFRPDADSIRRIFRVGLPTGVQMAVVSFSNVFVQGYINAFGDSSAAGWGIRTRLEAFLFLPMQSMGLAATTFTGQNIGAGKIDRVREGVRSAMGLSLLITFLIGLPVFIFAPQCAMLFSRDAEVLRYAVIYLRFCLPFTLAACTNQIHAGALRGAGDAGLSMVLMLVSFVAFRQVYLAIASHLTDSVYPIAFGYPAGWILCSILMFAVFRSRRWERDLQRESHAPAL